MQEQKPTREEKLDDTIDDSFPASDPPSHSGVTGAGHQHQATPPAKPEGDRDAKGHPTSDRQKTETAHADETDQMKKDGEVSR